MSAAVGLVPSLGLTAGVKGEAVGDFATQQMNFCHFSMKNC